MGEDGEWTALIAVVDDDYAICNAISSLLRSVGYRCVTFGSAEEFLESGSLKDAHCILLDFRMPGMNGLELQLRLNHIESQIPIIYVTATSDCSVRERAVRWGAAGYFSKPFDAEDLLSAIHAALYGRNTRELGRPLPSNC